MSAVGMLTASLERRICKGPSGDTAHETATCDALPFRVGGGTRRDIENPPRHALSQGT